MKKLTPKAKWLFCFKIIFKLIFLFLFLGLPLIVFTVGIIEQVVSFANFTSAIIFIVAIVVLIALLISYIAALLVYKNYEYGLTEEGFRKKYGVISKKDISIPYERIQNVDIERSIIARILGLSEVNIQTAGEMATIRGAGSLISQESEGFIPGVLPEEAERIRKKLINRAKG